MVMSRKPKINKGFIPAGDYTQKAKDSMTTWGTTNLYSTGDPFIDEYLGGGYGRQEGYEILTIFGDTGMNKSTLASSLVLDPASRGVPVGYFALEDDPVDVDRRLLKQCGTEEMYEKVIQNIFFLPENSGYTLGQMGELIEQAFTMFDIIVVDPIQFIFEASVEERGETEFNRQRLFMREMNNTMKHTNKTLILVSHTNKGGGKFAAEGLAKIIGSSAIAQVSTKVLEINRKDGVQGIRLWKTRFTPYRHTGFQITLKDMRISSPYETKDLPALRRAWNGETI